MKVDRFISVVAPLSNCADIVESYIGKTIPILGEYFTNYELVLVDDGSQDDTVSKVIALLSEYPGIRLIRLSRQFGEEVAISAGLDTVIGDYVVVMLPRMDPPEIIPEIVARSLSGIDVVFGVRRTHHGESWLTRKAAAGFYWYCRRVLRLDLPKDSTQLRCLSRQAVNAIIQIKDNYRYLRLFSSYVGYKRQRFLYDPIDGHGRRRNLVKSVNTAIELVMENSTHPLRLVSWLGLGAASLNLVYALYVIVVYIFKQDVLEGWTTISLQNAGQFFLITLILTALSEYTGRMHLRMHDRPLYYVLEERDSTVLLLGQERQNIVEDSKEIHPPPQRETSSSGAAL